MPFRVAIECRDNSVLTKLLKPKYRERISQCNLLISFDIAYPHLVSEVLPEFIVPLHVLTYM